MQEAVDATANLSTVYAIYAVVSAGLTVWLARILGENGRVFLRDVFPDKSDLADAVNKLLVVGFYLVNFGYALLLMRGGNAPTMVTAIEALSMKLGWLLLSLAFMHFFNLVVLHRIRRKAVEERQAPHPYRHAPVPYGPAMQGGVQGGVPTAYELLRRAEERAAVQMPAAERTVEEPTPEAAG